MGYRYEPGFGLTERKIVHDGCILCGKHKGERFYYLYDTLLEHGEIKRICSECNSAMEEEKELIKTSFHEAGHVVAILSIGLKFKVVTNLSGRALQEAFYKDKSPTGDPMGDLIYFGSVKGQVQRDTKLARNPDEITNQNFDKIKNRLIIDLAGDVAVGLLLGEVNENNKLNLSEDMIPDYSEFKVLIKKQPEFEPYFDRFRAYTVSLLKSRWDKVARIATTLLEERYLYYDRCVELFNKK